MNVYSTSSILSEEQIKITITCQGPPTLWLQLKRQITNFDVDVEKLEDSPSVGKTVK